MEQVPLVDATRLEDRVEAPASVLRFSPGQVATGYAPTVLPSPVRLSTFPLLVKVLGCLLLFISFSTMYLAAAGWENALIQNHGLYLRLEYAYGALVFSICTIMCLWGARGMIVKDDPERGFVAGLCLVGTFGSYTNLWDIGILDLPGGACGAFFLILALTFAFLLLLHIVRRRRTRIEAFERGMVPGGPDGVRP